MALLAYIHQRRARKDILIMTHQILGYPSFEINEKAMDAFYRADVDMVELQIPFSEPVADGPLFLRANQMAVEKGVKVAQCMEFAHKMVQKFRIPILLMTYYNIVYKYGVEAFLDRCKEIGIYGLIVPDAPMEDAQELYDGCKKRKLDIVGLATAYTEPDRLAQIAQMAEGFIYYIPRKGVTGSKTKFEPEVLEKIKAVGALTRKRIGVGFGIQDREDVERLKGVCDIAIIGSQVLKTIEESGVEGLEAFLNRLCKK
jgi:tryptophan synthase alpha chain